jgi:hypothetical protein
MIAPISMPVIVARSVSCLILSPWYTFSNQ